MGLLRIILTLVAMLTVTSHQIPAKASTQKSYQELASHSMSLADRYNVASVNDVFKANILLTIAYMRGIVSNAAEVNWDTVEKPFHYQFTLRPGENFAFHDQVLPQYQGKISYTTHAHFDIQEGFLSDGYLPGDGVCHAASLMAWVAKDAGLAVTAPTPHDFAVIPDVPKQDGVAIYDSPGESQTSALQNLYITNNKNKPVIIAFDYTSDQLQVTASEIN